MYKVILNIISFFKSFFLLKYIKKFLKMIIFFCDVEMCLVNIGIIKMENCFGFMLFLIFKFYEGINGFFE